MLKGNWKHWHQWEKILTEPYSFFLTYQLIANERDAELIVPAMWHQYPWSSCVFLISDIVERWCKSTGCVVAVLESDDDARSSDGGNDAAWDHSTDVWESGLWDAHVWCSLLWLFLLIFPLKHIDSIANYGRANLVTWSNQLDQMRKNCVCMFEVVAVIAAVCVCVCLLWRIFASRLINFRNIRANWRKPWRFTPSD